MTAAAEQDVSQLRDAVPEDNEALIRLAAACTMAGDVSLRVDRAPDFFALNRLEGDASRVGVVTGAGGDRVIGCVAAARRRAYVNGAERTIGYVSDLKVDPSARGSGVADVLTEYAREVSRELCGLDAPVLCTILAGNRRMEHRSRGPRDTPVLTRFASLSVLAIPLLWERSERPSGVRVHSVQESDVEALCDTWTAVSHNRQFADARDADGFSGWVRSAPGLALHDYLVARDARGTVRGFLGVWDQSGFKQLRVVSYSRRLAVVRHAINAAAPLVGAAPLPRAGAALPALATVHVCAMDAIALRALVLEAYRRHRGGRHAFLTIGLDTRDSLLPATGGLLAQPTLVHAYVTTPRGSADPGQFNGLPLHYETALV
jgi:hypothetical protein